MWILLVLGLVGSAGALEVTEGQFGASLYHNDLVWDFGGDDFRVRGDATGAGGAWPDLANGSWTPDYTVLELDGVITTINRNDDPRALDVNMTHPAPCPECVEGEQWSRELPFTMTGDVWVTEQTAIPLTGQGTLDVTASTDRFGEEQSLTYIYTFAPQADRAARVPEPSTWVLLLASMTPLGLTKLAKLRL